MSEATGLIIAVFLFVLLGIGIVAEYNHESDITAEVVSVNTQKYIQGNKEGFNTSYKYLVATDKGTLEISPDGLFASPQFGTLQEGKVYDFHLRGYSIPLIRLYPFIIEAKEQTKTDGGKNVQ